MRTSTQSGSKELPLTLSSSQMFSSGMLITAQGDSEIILSLALIESLISLTQKQGLLILKKDGRLISVMR